MLLAVTALARDSSRGAMPPPGGACGSRKTGYTKSPCCASAGDRHCRLQRDTCGATHQNEARIGPLLQPTARAQASPALKKECGVPLGKAGLSGRLPGKTLTMQSRSMPRRGDEHGSPEACAGGVVSGAVTHVDCEPFGGSQDSRRGVTQLDRACQLLPSSGFPGSVSQCHFRSKLLPLEAVCSMLDLIDQSVV